MIAPTLSNATVTLRPHRVEDMEPYWAFFCSPRAALMDRPSSPTHLWYGFASEVGSWVLQGQGGWAVETPDGRLAGQIAVSQPPHFPEREIGWFLLDGFEGMGLAHAAATLARDWAFDALKADSLVSYIHRDNARSIRLAERLGAVRDDAADRHDDTDVVYRHRRVH
ncbi:N-acetyltransferase [Primorskyibacter flagellatus]|uniref:N-acetyltransferase n=1 Tax=Primorskyibacter flagellatus TaxID=1387277 RepID=A0A917AAZ8_9RHOB|nr:GNAT family N-acetyltransferase [Primorskyibacter flagellatus]GGE38164.1 N-acetyltransferase [Primorskyibacter flagellatus]